MTDVKVYKILVPISGGKDSQACLKMAVQQHGADNVLGLFCDTQFEHPLTYAHVENMKKLYGVEIRTICAGSVPEKVRKYKRFPGGGARHCTEELKIRGTRDFCRDLAQEQGAGFEVWYGMRTGESSARAKRYEDKHPDDLYPPHEVLPRKYPKYLEKMGVMFRMPILDWLDQEVFDFLEGQQNPLYSQGFNRVGCFPCLAAGDAWKLKAFKHDDFGRSQLIVVKQLEDEIGKSIWTSSIGRNSESDEPGCSVCSI